MASSVGFLQPLPESILGCMRDEGTPIDFDQLELWAALSQLVQKNIGEPDAVGKINLSQLRAVIGKMLDGLVGELVALGKINL